MQSEYKFESTTAATHALGTEVVNLNNIFPLYMLGKFKEQFLSTFPKNFATGVTESTVIKRIKDFYASKGTGRSFQFVSGHPSVESTVTTLSVKFAPKSSARTVLYGVTNVPSALLVSTSIS